MRKISNQRKFKINTDMKLKKKLSPKSNTLANKTGNTGGIRTCMKKSINYV